MKLLHATKLGWAVPGLAAGGPPMHPVVFGQFRGGRHRNLGSSKPRFQVDRISGGLGVRHT